MDIQKWMDHVLCASIQARQLLLSFHGIRQMTPSSGLQSLPALMDSTGDACPFSYTFQDTLLNYEESRPWPRVPGLEVLMDSGLGSLRKLILKQFSQSTIPSEAILKNLGAHRPHIQRELGPVYERLGVLCDYFDTATLLTQQSVKFFKLSMSTNPQMCLEFLGLINLNASLVYLISDLQADLKVVATLYAAAMSVTGNSTDISSSWLRISKLLSAIDKPFAFLMDQNSLVAPRIASLVLEIAPDIDSKLLLSAQSYRKEGILSLVPELSGVRAPELDDKSLRSIGSLHETYKTLVMGVLLSPNECSKRPELLDILQNTFAFGSVVTLVRDSSLNLISDFEAFGKMNQKTARVQAMTQDATNGKGFSAAWGFHKERRDYLRYQIKQMLNLAHDTSLLKKKTTTVLAALRFSKEEVCWYFRHYDNVFEQELKARKRKDTLEPDYRIFELIQITMQLGKKVLAAQDSLIDNEIVKLRNPEMTCVAASLISKFIETCKLAQDPVGIILQEIWRTLDAIHHQGLEGLDLEALRMNWRRVQVYVSLASDLVVDRLYEELVPIMTEIFEKSLLIQRFPDHVKAASTFRELYYFLPSLKLHAKLVLNRGVVSELLHLECIGPVVESFLENACDAWPEEFNVIVAQSTAFATGFYSALGALTGFTTHQVSVYMSNFEAQFLPVKTFGFFSRPAPLQSNSSVRGRKKKTANAPAPTMQRPGYESSLKNPTDIEQRIQEMQSRLSSLASILNRNDVVRIYDTEVNTKVYFADSMIRYLNRFLVNTITLSEEDAFGSFGIQRPSIVYSKLLVYMQALHRVHPNLSEYILPILSSVYKSMLSTDRATTALEKANCQQKTRDKEIQSFLQSDDLSVLAVYARCYSFTFLFETNDAGILEYYANDQELEALCQLVGQSGVEFIANRLQLNSLPRLVKDFTQVNSQVLNVIDDKWCKEGFKENLKRVKGFKELLTSLTRSGFELKLADDLNSKAENLWNSFEPSFALSGDTSMKEGGRLVSLVFATVIAMKLSEDTVRLYSVSSNTSTCRWIMEAFHHVLRSVCSSPEELKTYYQLFLEYTSDLVVFYQQGKEPVDPLRLGTWIDALLKICRKEIVPSAWLYGTSIESLIWAAYPSECSPIDGSTSKTRDTPSAHFVDEQELAF